MENVERVRELAHKKLRGELLTPDEIMELAHLNLDPEARAVYQELTAPLEPARRARFEAREAAQKKWLEGPEAAGLREKVRALADDDALADALVESYSSVGAMCAETGGLEGTLQGHALVIWRGRHHFGLPTVLEFDQIVNPEQYPAKGAEELEGEEHPKV